MISVRLELMYLVHDLIYIDLRMARQLLGPDAIIGVTASSSSQACIASDDGATYLGIGTMFATQT